MKHIFHFDATELILFFTLNNSYDEGKYVSVWVLGFVPNKATFNNLFVFAVFDYFSHPISTDNKRSDELTKIIDWRGALLIYHFLLDGLWLFLDFPFFFILLSEFMLPFLLNHLRLLILICLQSWNFHLSLFILI